MKTFVRHGEKPAPRFWNTGYGTFEIKSEAVEIEWRFPKFRFTTPDETEQGGNVNHG